MSRPRAGKIGVALMRAEPKWLIPGAALAHKNVAAFTRGLYKFPKLNQPFVFRLEVIVNAIFPRLP